MDKYTGKRIDGRYEIHELIGVGGMASVYRAFDNQEKRFVAIKILKEEYANNSEFLRRFRNESRAVAMLSHPNIVKIYDVSFGDVIQYIVMEYLDGVTLKEYISKHGPLQWREALHYIVQVLRALQHAHERGIIHRDVKPQNIMLLPDGNIKVTDFGIARMLQGETQTMTDKALGSVHYIAPEQARGEFTSDKVDIYSVGVMMYEMLTGQLPFVADNAVSVAIMQMQAIPRNPREINPSIPIGLEEITMRAMEKNPAMRFQSAKEMLIDIQSFISNPTMTFNYSFSQDIESTKPIDLYTENELRQTQAPKPVYKAPSYNDSYEYEEELVKSTKHAKGSMILTGVISAIIIVTVAFLGYYIYNFLTSSNTTTDEVLLPDFVGMNYETDIKDNTKYSDFTFTVTVASDSGKSDGTVLKQSPSGGIYVKVGKEVQLTVAGTTDSSVPVVIPSETGNKQTDGYNELKNLGLIPQIETINDDKIEAGLIVRTDPAEGTTVNSGSTVKIYVSKGPTEEQVAVPDVIGSSLSSAKELLESSKLQVGTVTYDDNSELAKDVVISCSPDVSKKVSINSSVDLVVSSGKKTEKNVQASIPLPSNVNEDISLKIYVDGELTDETTINPAYSSSYVTTFTGKTGTANVVVMLNSQDYIYGTVDYDNQEFTITQQNTYKSTVSSATTESSSKNDDSNASSQNKADQ